MKLDDDILGHPIPDELREALELLLSQEDFRYIAIVLTGQSISTVRNLVAGRGTVTKRSWPVYVELVKVARKRAKEMERGLSGAVELLDALQLDGDALP